MVRAPLMRRARLGLLAGVAASLVYLSWTLYPAASTAQEDDGVQSYFIEEVVEEDALSGILARAIRPLEMTLNRTGAFQLVGTEEMEIVYSDCSEQIGVSADALRECQLNAARRTLVDWYIVLKVEQLDETLAEVVLQVWDPEENRRVAVDAVELPGEPSVPTTRAAVQELACRMLRHPQFMVESALPQACEREAASETAATRRAPAPGESGIEVVDVTPSPVQVSVDGERVGLGPGSFVVEPGERAVSMQASGHEPWQGSVSVSQGQVTTIAGVELVPQPAHVVISSNVGGASVFVDDVEVGHTDLAGSTSIRVTGPSATIRVQRDGFLPFVEDIQVAPGGAIELEATLGHVVCGNGIVEEGEACDDGNAASGDGCSAQCQVEAPDGFVYVPAGTFTMGSPPGEDGRSDDERRVEVSISRPFFLLATELTRAEWRELIDQDPSRFDGCGASCPVESMTWWAALAYLNARSDSEGFARCFELHGCESSPGNDLQCSSATFVGLDCEGYRLPTEAEWEYAARAGTQTAIYTGDVEIESNYHAPALEPVAYFVGNSRVDYDTSNRCGINDRRAGRHIGVYPCGTHPVGEKQPNAWGLYDMLGNVAEWVWDYYGDYPFEPVVDPTGPETGEARVYRGGKFGVAARFHRSAARASINPDIESHGVGFRPARTAR